MPWMPMPESASHENNKIAGGHAKNVRNYTVVYPLVSSNMAMENPPGMEILIGKSQINGPFSSTPSLIAKGFPIFILQYLL